jgi:hypothetical protein
MNEMIEIRQKLGESEWDIDQRFKQLKGKLKYLMTNMQHRHMSVNSLLPNLKYPLRQQKFQTQVEALTSTYCKNFDVLFAALWTKLSILSENRGNLKKKNHIAR